MLDDLTENFQRLSVNLPPDGWDLDAPTVRVQRQASGVLDLRPIDGTANEPNDASRSDDNLARGGRDEEDGLLESVDQRGLNGEGNDDRGQRKSMLSFLKRCVCHRHRRSRSISSVASSMSASIYESFKTSLKSMWPFSKRNSDNRRRRKRRKISGTELLL